MTEFSWWTYIIRTQDNQLYTGITTDVARRWQQHLSGKGAKYFRAHRPLCISYLEQNIDRRHASQREYAIKQLSKSQKEALLKEHQDRTLQLSILWSLPTNE